MPSAYEPKSICPMCGQQVHGLKGILWDAETGVVGRRGYAKFAKLTPFCARLFAELYKARGRIVHKDTFLNALHGLRPDCDRPAGDGHLNVLLSECRDQLARIDLMIDVVRGFGWRLSDGAVAPIDGRRSREATGQFLPVRRGYKPG